MYYSVYLARHNSLWPLAPGLGATGSVPSRDSNLPRLERVEFRKGGVLSGRKASKIPVYDCHILTAYLSSDGECTRFAGPVKAIVIYVFD